MCRSIKHLNNSAKIYAMVQLETKLLLATTVLTATGIGLLNFKQNPDISYATDAALTLTAGAVVGFAVGLGIGIRHYLRNYIYALAYGGINKAKEGYETLADLTLLVGHAVNKRYYGTQEGTKVLVNNEKLTSL